VIALLLREISIILNLRHKRMFKCGGKLRTGYLCGTQDESDHSEDRYRCEDRIRMYLKVNRMVERGMD
jgi:hypothetical protein